ncbi:Pollen Ole e 1 allergen and extensin family protein [Forsythia ovata]|uniref:Pollen Ole e 1 allergen and extensin family protein n=1 Tax=Forsythia ovata TaxID=205694 RepID=A0ABD1VGB1_9LAMI
MEKYQLLIALFLTVALAKVELSTSHVLKGSVTCLDCNTHYDLSGIQVLVKCANVKKLAAAYTEEDGSFETELPSDSSSASPKCLARIMGGPNQLYSSRKNSVSLIVKANESEYYTTHKSLNLYTSCPLALKCGAGAAAAATNKDFGASKTVDLPLPSEWGLAPTSYYFPYLPIIGIP